MVIGVRIPAPGRVSECYPRVVAENIAKTFREDIAQVRRLDTYRAAFSGLAQSVTGRLDAWLHEYTGLGGTRDRSVGMAIADFRVLSWAELDAMYHGEDLPAKIVDALPTDALSAGFSLGAPGLDRLAQEWRLAEIILEGRIWARLHGAGGILIGTSRDTGPMDSPLRLAAIRRGALEYLLPVDRMDLSIAETNQEPRSPTHGDPLMYRIGDQLVHPSRLILFPGARTSSRQRARTGGWDLSVLQRPYGVLRDFETGWRSAVNVLSDLSQAVFAIKGLSGMIANGQKSVVMDRMEITDMARSVARAVVIDADSERFEHVGAQNIAGIDPILMRFATRLAGAAGMPATILLGISPAGMNATGESDLSIWYKACAGERKLLEPAIHYLGAVLARDAGLSAPEGVTWPKMWELSELEQADLEGRRATAAGARVLNQITTPDEERAHLGGLPLATVIREANALEADEPDREALDGTPDIDVTAGEMWTDTEDGHRLRVSGLDSRYVYFQDLDGANPDRQWKWVLGSFLERCMRTAAGPGAAPVPP